MNLIDYAQNHRLRIRDLHDGHSVPPFRQPGKWRRPRWSQDSMPAIVGRRGCIHEDGDRLGFVIVRRIGLNSVVAEVERRGGRVPQRGDGEIGGTIDWEQIEWLLEQIQVYRRRKAPANAADHLREHRFDAIK